MALPSKNAWSGSGAILIGGGPSLATLDWDHLASWCKRTHTHSIVVNRAFKDFPTADIWFSEDWRTVKLWANDARWCEFNGVKILHALEDSFATNAYSYAPELECVYRPVNRPIADKFWSDDFSNGLSLSSNSMIGALNIADILGANPIYLLGVDCNTADSKTHYHDDYDRARKTDPSWGKTGDQQLMSFASDFEHWAALHLRKNGRHVMNLNPRSAVKCWPRIHRDLVIK